jgi:hypothetical protein
MQRQIKGLSSLFSFFVMVCLFSASVVFGQTGTTSLRGTVSDKSGASVAGATILLVNTAQALEREISSGNSGEYEFLAVPPGTYTLTVEKDAFRKYEQSNLQLLVNSPGTVNVTLEIGSATQTVEVNAQTQTLNTTDASLGVAFSERQVKELPMEGRNVPDLLSLQAGVTYTGNRPDINRNIDTRSGAVNGAHSDQSNITLDGVDANDAGGNAFTSVLPVTLDSVQEFRVTTTNYNANEGRSSGAQVALITKSGSNDFHGSAYEYNRNTLTSANDYLIKLSQLQNGNPNQAPKLIRNIFGGSLGGPIKKDRLFFFANFEGARQREENAATRIVPTASLRDGVMIYQCTDPASCPAGTVQGISGTAYNVPAGSHGLSPQDITSMDPQSKGPNQAMLAYFNSFPLPNDNTQGDGLGYNYSGFRFRGPIKKDYNYYIARLDYKLTSNGNHTLFWRGALSNYQNPGVPFLPGEAPELSIVNYNKGSVVGYTAILRPNLVSNFRWGFTRESVGTIGNSTEQVIYFRGINDHSGDISRTRSFQRPTHNFAEDLSWVRGNHTFQFGAAMAFIRNPRNSQQASFSSGTTNASWLDVAGFANTGADFDPTVTGRPDVDPNFANSYDYPLIALLGMVTEADASYNYLKDGSVLPQGAPVKRHFAFNGYEFYGQDSWKIKPNLTLTFGLRWSLFSPPWETTGLQVSPNFSLTDFFNKRAANMSAGVPSNVDPDVQFDLSGPANGGKPGFYHWDKKNLGPRVSLAYSPRPSSGLLRALFGGGDKSTIRAGFGVVYDRIGAGLLSTFDQNGSFGLSTTLTNPAGIITAANAPRLTDIHTIPTQDTDGNTIFFPAPPGQFPQTFPNTLDTGGFAITWGLDDKIKTPYSYTLDFSVGRELPKGFSIDVSYVGRLSHRLLIQEDLAMPLDLVDTKTGVDYFSAATALAKVYRTGVATEDVTAAMIGPTAQFWTDMIQPVNAGGLYRIRRCTNGAPSGTADPIQAAYDLFCGFSGNETTALSILDLGGIRDFTNDPNCDNPGFPACVFYGPTTGFNSYFNKQFSSLYAWRSMANANYHALQVNLRKRIQNGVQFDFNYTFSKSIDLASDAERIGFVGGLGGQIINSWAPKSLRAVSDFDTTHQFNANWIAELPFGKGKSIGRNSNAFADAIIGGWQLSGLVRWTSGFPLNVFNGAQWPTNWELGGEAQPATGPVSTKRTKFPDGSVSIFPQGIDAVNLYRQDFPGESGARNNIRGDGYFGVDLGLTKRWKMPWSERHNLIFRWEVFNVTNSVRFDVQSIAPSIDSTGSFGNYQGLLTNPRVMQFALRYEF